MNIEIDKELAELWELTGEWASEVKRKTWRSACRIGSTIEFKNDKKRVEEARILLRDLEELEMLFFEESGLLEQAKAKFESQRTHF